ncbi:amino acid adenylation domain-containing protein [Nocardia thailandica]
MSDTDAGKLSVLERRKQLLQQRLRDAGLNAAPAAELPAARPGERYPLSAGQRRMWFLQTRDAADSSLNVCLSYRLRGALDEQRLRAAFATVVNRHEILRTAYGADESGEPFQVIAERSEPVWQSVDLTDLDESARPHRVQVLARREFATAFDLTAGVPLRATLVRTGAEEFVLLIVVHHIAVDDESWAVLFADLNAAYNSAAAEPAAAQYVSVEVLGGAEEPGEADIEYWREALRPLPEPIELPGSPAAAPTKAAERRTAELPADLLARVEDFAKRHSATPFMVLLAAYDALIHRYTAAPDFLVAVPVTSRRAAAEDLVGYFGNTLLLRAQVRRADTFATFVDAVRDTCLAGFAHQNVGIDRVVREANPERVAGRDGMDQLVRLGFSVRKSTDAFALDAVTAEPVDLGAPSAQVPLALAVVLEPAGAVLEIEYQTDVLAEPLVEALLSHYVQLLDAALSAPDARLADLDMLGAADRAAVLAQSHGAALDLPATTLVALLERTAAERAGDLAVVADDTELTYADLHRRANRLAHLLIGEGVGPEDLVGLRLGTSVEFVVAMLAVLKTGAGYLPIDPAYPDDRIAYLVDDAAPKLVLGRVELDAAEATAANLPEHAPTDAERVRPLHPDHLAYVIYTSGSTGAPKGVPVSHRAIAAHITGFTAEWTFGPDDRVLQCASVSFDASMFDLFGTLSVGARLVVPKPDAFRDIRYIADLITRRGVTVMSLVPSVLSTFMLLPEVSEWRSLRYVPVGGEALPGEVADKFAGLFEAELRNHYGPTEAVVCSTHMLVEGPQGTGVVPIGVPNAQVCAYVLDEALQLVPAGVVGELYLGGDQLARGYLGRPGLSAHRFVADPFNPGQRLYRSGDLVRRNSFGELEFVGRADEQVKVRGFRIELGEVESALASHPSVGHAVVVVAEDPAVGPMLAAYLVPAAGAEVDVEAVRAHVAAGLPEYMVPAAFAVIPEIPLTVNGKLDKRALPAPSPAAERSFRAPATATERRLATMFAELFGLEKVGADDSFFDLGGHSLLAARLVAQIRAEFGLEFDVRVVFDTPTPAGLAAKLVAQFRDEFDIDLDSVDDGDDDPAATADAPVAAPAGTRPPVTEQVRPEWIPLSYSQLAMWFQYRMEGATEAGNLPFALRLDGPLDVAALRAAINDIVDRHESLRTNFPEHGGVPYQLVHPSRPVETELREIAPERLEETLTELRGHLFEVETEPLIRPTLLAMGPHTHVLSLLLHHIVTDHASLGIFLDDLRVAYRARVAGAAPTWTPLPVQFADYALWQHSSFDHAAAFGKAEVEHWRARLAGLPDEISVAPDRPRPPVLGKRGEVVVFAVSPERRAVLEELGKQSGVSEFMVYQAVVATLLHALGGGDDIALGTPVACRVDPAVDTLVGLFANMVVLRNDITGDPTLRELVARSRDTVLDAFGHQELPIERLVEALNPPRSRSRNPLFQSMIHFRGVDYAPVPQDLAGTGETTLTVIPTDFDISFLDLNLSLNVTVDGGLDVRVVVNADLYDAATAASIAAALDATLTAFAEAPDSRVSALEVLPADELARLLAEPVAAESGAAAAAAQASEETLRTLITLLEELLEIDDVTPEDNFFALGGDSVISIQWSARAKELGLPLTPQLVFEHMSVAELAAAVDAADPEADEQESAPQPESAPMSASGLDSDALAALTASWQSQA